MNFFTKITFFSLLVTTQISFTSEESTAASENLKTIKAFVNMNLANPRTTLESFNECVLFAHGLIDELTPSEKTIASQLIDNTKTILTNDGEERRLRTSYASFLKSHGLKDNSPQSHITK